MSANPGKITYYIGRIGKSIVRFNLTGQGSGAGSSFFNGKEIYEDVSSYKLDLSTVLSTTDINGKPSNSIYISEQDKDIKKLGFVEAILSKDGSISGKWGKWTDTGEPKLLYEVNFGIAARDFDLNDYLVK
ncbi:MAG: hypothetical protein WCK98_03100 [bacterium]